MIYLFSNDGYGRPFWERAKVLARAGSMEITLVFSGKRGPRNRLREIGFRMRAGFALRFVPNVNAPAFLNRLRPGDCGIIAGFNQIFRAETIGRFEVLVNFHPSILPLYRGPVPSHWCLENGEEWSGYTLHRVTEKVDEGEVLFQDRVAVEGAADAAALDRRIAERAVPVFERFLDHLRKGGDWERRTLDAHALYRTHLDYASFPKRPSAKSQA